MRRVKTHHSMSGIVQASKHEAYRFALVGALAAAYTSVYLGRPLTSRAIQNSALIAGSSIASEFAVRQIMGRVTSSGGVKAPVFMGAEAVGSGVIYAAAYPRIIGGRSPGFTSLATTAALLDIVAQFSGARIAKMLEGDADAYTAY